MVLGFNFVAGLLVEQRKIRVNESLVWPHFLRLTPLFNGSRVVALSIKGHAEAELGIEMRGVLLQDSLKLRQMALSNWPVLKSYIESSDRSCKDIIFSKAGYSTIRINKREKKDHTV